MRRTIRVSRAIGHGAVIAAGWVLFVVYWVKVARDTASASKLATLILVVGLSVLNLGLMGLWIRRNLRLHRRRWPRSKLPEVSLPAGDYRGRRLVADWDACRDSGLVNVVAHGYEKSFVPSGGGAAAGIPGNGHARSGEPWNGEARKEAVGSGP